MSSKVSIVGVCGSTGVNGRHTVTAINGNIITIDVAPGGTYVPVVAFVGCYGRLQSGSAHVTRSSVGFDGDSLLFRLDSVGTIAAYRLPKDRSLVSDGRFRALARQALHTDRASGEMEMVWTANMGSGDYKTYALRSPTGLYANLKPNQFDPTHSMSIEAGDTFAVVRYQAPSTGACVIKAGPYWDFSTYLSGYPFTDDGGTQDRVKVITGLTASTRYWIKIECDNFWAARLPIDTLPTLTSTATAQLSIRGVAGADNVVIEYDTTAGAFGSTSSPASCASGSLCSVSLTAAKGLTYYRFNIRDSGNTSLYRSPEYSTTLR